ncbi:MAG: hypothetical protein AABY86_02120, partial [Bdellovibrionota bacterium]
LSGLTISGSATSTSNVGFNLTAGCFAVNGTCLSGTLAGSGAANRVGYCSEASTLTSNSGFTFDGTTLTSPVLVASSASATSTLAGGLTIETSGFVYDYSTNRVGIGTTSPWARLSIEAAAGMNTFAIGSSTATHFVVSSSGNVGIGMLVTHPQIKLHVDRNIYATGAIFYNHALADVIASGIVSTQSQSFSDIQSLAATIYVPLATRISINVILSSLRLDITSWFG